MITDAKFTRCPGCSTVFRVTIAQLALREGQVRCGHCRAVFDANDHFVSLEAAPPGDDFDATDELITGRPTVTLRSADALERVEAKEAVEEKQTAVEAPAVEATGTSSASRDAVPNAVGSVRDDPSLPASPLPGDDATPHDSNIDAERFEPDVEAKVSRDGASNAEASTATDDEASNAEARSAALDVDNTTLDAEGSNAATSSAEPAHADVEASNAVSASVESPSATPQAATSSVDGTPEHSTPKEVDASAEAESAVEPSTSTLEKIADSPFADARLDRPEQSQADGGPIDLARPAPSARFEWKKRRTEDGSPRRLLAGAAVALGIGIVLQVVLEFRDTLAARVPVTRPALEAACSAIGCTIDPLRDAGALSIDASDLQADPAHRGLLLLSATLRNRSSHAIAYPLLELTLTDSSDQVVARRAFTPAEYAGGTADTQVGIPANGERVVRMFLDASATQQAGYRLYLFYP